MARRWLTFREIYTEKRWRTSSINHFHLRERTEFKMALIFVHDRRKSHTIAAIRQRKSATEQTTFIDGFSLVDRCVLVYELITISCDRATFLKCHTLTFNNVRVLMGHTRFQMSWKVIWKNRDRHRTNRWVFQRNYSFVLCENLFYVSVVKKYWSESNFL